MAIRWWSQPFAPEGSAAADGIVKQLGMPALDPLEVLAREAAQNSWDARLEDSDVEFAISIDRVADQQRTLAENLLPAPNPDSIGDFQRALARDSWIVTVSDRGTRGLAGPIRADVAVPGARSDFVQFIRNVGEPRDNSLGGGTYGFGKGIFYRLSSSSTIVVDTKFGENEDDRRLMGAALGKSFVDGAGRRFTGRHWWGRIAEDGLADPIEGREAAEVSRRLGLPGFENGRRGTDVVVLGADLGSTDDDEGGHPRSPQEAATFIASSILWHLWPKMLGGPGFHVMRFAVKVNGVDVPIPTPDSVSDLAPFAAALRRVRAGEGDVFSRTVPPKTAGSFAIEVTAVPPDEGQSAVVRAARPFDGPLSHVARMRQAELVVDYYAAQAHPNRSLQWAGVFKASAEADDLFAASEPPTHDAWSEKGLTGSAKGVVSGSRSFIRKRLEALFAPQVSASAQGLQGLGAFASRLAGLLPADATSAPRGGGRGGGGGTRASSLPVITWGPSLAVSAAGMPYIAARVKLPARSGTTRFPGQASVVLDGGASESAPPAGADTTEVYLWRSVERPDDVTHGRDLELLAGEAEEWWVYAKYVRDAMIRLTVGRGEPVDG